MDCEACNNLLLDHLYGELDEVRAAAVRKHLDGCASCGGAFERLSRGRRAARTLQPVEAAPPSDSLLEAIRAAAAAHAQPATAPAVASVVPIDAARPRVPRWLHRVGEMAMRRQVAMAAVFLLMIGFGLSYHQFQAPTRPVQMSDEPEAQVIPARELSPPEGAATAERPQVTRRAAPGRMVGLGDRGAEHREAQAPRPAPAPVARQAEAPAEIETPTPDEQVAQAPSRTQNDGVQNAPSFNNVEPNRQAALGRAGNAVEPPAAYRNLPPAPAAPAGNVAANQRLTGDPALDRALPPSPLGTNAVAAAAQNQAWAGSQAAQAVPAQAQELQAPAWRSLRDDGERAMTQRRSAEAAAAFREALNHDPPEADRVAIARRLHAALMEQGRVSEAAEVQGRYLTRANNAAEYANQLPPPSQNAPSIARPAVSHPMPSRAAPRRRSVSPSQGNAYDNTFAY